MLKNIAYYYTEATLSIALPIAIQITITILLSIQIIISYTKTHQYKNKHEHQYQFKDRYQENQNDDESKRGKPWSKVKSELRQCFSKVQGGARTAREKPRKQLSLNLRQSHFKTSINSDYVSNL